MGTGINQGIKAGQHTEIERQNMRWYCIETNNGTFCGRLRSTEAEMKRWWNCTIKSNGQVIVYGVTTYGNQQLKHAKALNG